MSSGLTPKQVRFVQEYLRELNAKKAAIASGYSENTAESQGSRLLSNAKVKAAVQRGMDERAKRVEVKQDDILRELLLIARADIRKAFDEKGRLLPIHELPEEVARAISGVEVDQLFDGAGKDRYHAGDTMKVKFWSKPQTLELLGRHLKLFTDKLEHAGKDGGDITISINRTVGK